MKNLEVKIQNLLKELIKQFNDYSELVALNYSKMRENKCDDEMLQWNRGSLNQIEENLKRTAEILGVELEFTCDEHTFGYDDWQRQLTYRTVRVK